MWARLDMQPDCFDLPIDINDRETIVRAVLTPWHVKMGKLKWQAFKPAPGKGLSVIRLCAGADYCKNKAVSIAAKNPNNKYIGLLSILAHDIRKAGSAIIDSRDSPNFFGHADVYHNLPELLPDEPALTPEDNDILKLRCEALVKVSILCCDPDPEAPNWTGDRLEQTLPE